ncbi:MAG: FAD-dependent oxidoreductase [Pseudomonadota bacterium]
MTHPLPFGAGRRVAVIGAGIAGMGAAYRLAGSARVTLIEAEPRLGGHARTVQAGRDGTQAVDTGFIVFNRVNYPNLTALFDRLGVELSESNMGFSASLDGGRMEWSGETWASIFGQRRNLVRPAFLKMLHDVVRFNTHAEAAVTADPDISIGDLITTLGLGDGFRDYYLLPFAGAIWSTPTLDVLDFPANTMIRFFKNHSLLKAAGRHRWYTVKGGAVEYVSRLEQSLSNMGVSIRCAAPVECVRRSLLGAEVKIQGAEWERFDEVVFACHADQALEMLSDATPAEAAALGAIRFHPNRAVLHADPVAMPVRERCWTAWNHVAPRNPTHPGIALTYWMNALQPIPKSDPLFVTLNATQEIREELIYDEVTFAHPLYTADAIRAQETLRRLNGARATWFCGAWMKNGFHEDGLASGLDVAEALLERQIQEHAA